MEKYYSTEVHVFYSPKWLGNGCLRSLVYSFGKFYFVLLSHERFYTRALFKTGTFCFILSKLKTYNAVFTFMEKNSEKNFDLKKKYILFIEWSLFISWYYSQDIQFLEEQRNLQFISLFNSLIISIWRRLIFIVDCLLPIPTKTRRLLITNFTPT